MMLIYDLHSIIRWIILIIAIISVVKYLSILMQKTEFSKTDNLLMVTLVGILDLQLLAGLILFVWLSISQKLFPSFRILHAVIMILAVVIVHLSAKWKKAENSIRAKNNLLCIISAIALILTGTFILP